MRIFFPILFAFAVLGAAPAVAGERPGGGHGCGGGCGGHGGHGRNINIDVHASANAYASASAGAGGFINARAYDVGAIGGRGPVHGGVIATGGDYGYGAVGGFGHGYGCGGCAPVYVSGPGYGPSRPFGYVVHGFGRRYVTTDRCRDCGAPPPPPPPCYSPCDGPYGAHGGGYSGGYASGSSYSVRESYSESEAYGGGHRYERDAGPYSPVEPRVYQPAPVHVTPSAGFYGDLPPGGYDSPAATIPYRQEPGERG